MTTREKLLCNLLVIISSLLCLVFLTGMHLIAPYEDASQSKTPYISGRLEGKLVSHGAYHWGDWVRVDLVQLFSQNTTSENLGVLGRSAVFGKVKVYYKDPSGSTTPSPSEIFDFSLITKGDTDFVPLYLIDWTGNRQFDIHLKYSDPSHSALDLIVRDINGINATGTLKKVPVPAFFTPPKNLCYQVNVEKTGWLPEVCDGYAAGTMKDKIKSIRVWSPDPAISICYQVTGSAFFAAGGVKYETSKEVCDGQEATFTGYSSTQVQIEGINVRYAGPQGYMFKGFAYDVRDYIWRPEVRATNNLFLGTKNKWLSLGAFSLRLEAESMKAKTLENTQNQSHKTVPSVRDEKINPKIFQQKLRHLNE